MVIKFPGTPIKVKRTQAPTAKWSTSSGYSEKSGWRWSPLSVDVIPTVEFRSSIVKERSVEKAAVDQLEFIHNNTSSTIALVLKVGKFERDKMWRMDFLSAASRRRRHGPGPAGTGKKRQNVSGYFLKAKTERAECWKRSTGCLV